MSGNILNLINKGFGLMRYFKVPALGLIAKKYVYKELEKCDPRKIKIDHAVRLIQESRECAVGQRVCNVLHKGADSGESVFLDELAIGLAQVGKADLVSKEQAVKTIERHRQNPIMITRVSGKYLEICRSLPKNCIYWNSEKRGLRCIQR
jgi:hypothetical protein